MNVLLLGLSAPRTNILCWRRSTVDVAAALSGRRAHQWHGSIALEKISGTFSIMAAAGNNGEGKSKIENGIGVISEMVMLKMKKKEKTGGIVSVIAHRAFLCRARAAAAHLFTARAAAACCLRCA